MLASDAINRVAAPRRGAAEEPLPVSKLGRIAREAGWVISLGLGLLLALMLATYSPLDPAWSHSAGRAPVRNAVGEFGAYASDLMLFVFGVSAWWWVILAALGLARLFRRVEAGGIIDRRSVAATLLGFVIVLAASCALESLRLHGLTAQLPGKAGGVLGVLVGGWARAALGYTGSTVLLLALLAAGISLLTGLSWIRLAEKIGETCERAWSALAGRWQERADRKSGEARMSVREERVAELKERMQERVEPIYIEPAVTHIEPSTRVIKEKQQRLFADLPDAAVPPLSLLDAPETHVESVSPETIEYLSRLIERKLLDFNVEVKVLAAYPGPVITRFEIEPAIGVKGSQILNLAKDLARSLSVMSIRVVETIPGKACMGLEVPNPKRQIVRLTEIVGSKAYADMTSPVTLALGKDIAGKPMVADLARMPHLLVAGTTGSGKSVAINAMILSLVYKAPPHDVRLILIDPKMLELSVYEGIPHLLAPVVTDMKQAATALNWCVAEMDRRYRLMSALGVRNLATYNLKVSEAAKRKEPIKDPTAEPDSDAPALTTMPMIVVVIDELADLMMVVGKKVEELIARLAQKARASGIHLVLATQRPSVDVITGLIKANVPTRIAFQVSSKVDSRTILDQQGAEALLGQGDMLYLPPGTGLPLRVHGAFVSDGEVHRVVDHLKQLGEPQYVEGLLDEPDESAAFEAGGQGGGEADPLYDQAVQIVLSSRRASISLVQRHLRIGYNRAARLIEDMERAGLVSQMQSNGNREILVPSRGEQ